MVQLVASLLLVGWLLAPVPAAAQDMPTATDPACVQIRALVADPTSAVDAVVVVLANSG